MRHHGRSFECLTIRKTETPDHLNGRASLHRERERAASLLILGPLAGLVVGVALLLALAARLGHVGDAVVVRIVLTLVLAPDDHVVTVAAVEVVLAVAAVERVVTEAADEHVFAVAADEQVVAVAAGQRILAVAAAELGVVGDAGADGDRVVAVAAGRED